MVLLPVLDDLWMRLRFASLRKPAAPLRRVPPPYARPTLLARLLFMLLLKLPAVLLLVPDHIRSCWAR
jgi:hypothetical protein